MKRACRQPPARSLLCLFLVTAPFALRCGAITAQGKVAGTGAAAAKGMASALAVAVAAADPDHRATLVAGAALTGAARAAAASAGRKIIDLQAVPQTADVSMPAGYLRIDSATSSGEEITVKLWRGPIPKAKPGILLLDCGTGLTFTLKRAGDGVWKIVSRGVSQC